MVRCFDTLGVDYTMTIQDNLRNYLNNELESLKQCNSGLQTDFKEVDIGYALWDIKDAIETLQKFGVISNLQYYEMDKTIATTYSRMKDIVDKKQ